MQLIELAPQEQYGNQVIAENAVVVCRRGEEIEFFHDRKDAGAWIQHVYGVRPGSESAREIGIEIKPIRHRGPTYGDAVVYRGPDDYWRGGKEKTEQYGILESLCGDLAICFNPSAFRQGMHVSCSGGPCPWILPESLTFIGLRKTRFWRWHDGYSGAHKGGDYYINVPLWLWDGTEPKKEKD